MKKQGYDTRAEISALEKIAKLGNEHSFLSSHPAPGKRTKRLKLQIEGKTSTIKENKHSLFDKFKDLLGEPDI